jgi:hypothetical protein
VGRVEEGRRQGGKKGSEGFALFARAGGEPQEWEGKQGGLSVAVQWQRQTKRVLVHRWEKVPLWKARGRAREEVLGWTVCAGKRCKGRRQEVVVVGVV